MEEINISSDDIRMLINDGVITVNENKRIIWLNDNYDGEFIKYKESFKNGEVYLYGDSVIIWCFPCEIFNCFDKVIISTYLFRGQLQCYYFQVNNIEFEYKLIPVLGVTRDFTKKHIVIEKKEDSILLKRAPM